MTKRVDTLFCQWKEFDYFFNILVLYPRSSDLDSHCNRHDALPNNSTTVGQSRSGNYCTNYGNILLKFTTKISNKTAVLAP